MAKERDGSLEEVARVASGSSTLRKLALMAVISITTSALGLLRWSFSQPWRSDSTWIDPIASNGKDGVDAKKRTVELDSRIQQIERAHWQALVKLEYEMYCPDRRDEGLKNCSLTGGDDFDRVMKTATHESAEIEAGKLIEALRKKAH